MTSKYILSILCSVALDAISNLTVRFVSRSLAGLTVKTNIKGNVSDVIEGRKEIPSLETNTSSRTRTIEAFTQITSHHQAGRPKMLDAV